MKIICIGRNYADHAKELNNPLPSKPVFFLKPETALIPKNMPFFIPDFTNDLHHEVELVVKINRLGKNIEERFAHKYYNEIGIGIDFTARDLQSECKSKGLPWEMAKAFDHSAPVSQQFINLEQLPPVNNIPFRLEKNGAIVQQGNSEDMIFSIDKIIAYVSQFFTLKIGDLIFTGTPAGVGQVNINDELKAFIGDKELMQLKIK